MNLGEQEIPEPGTNDPLISCLHGCVKEVINDSDGLSFEYDVFIEDDKLPEKYRQCWFADAINFGQERFGPDYYRPVVNELNLVDWMSTANDYTMVDRGTHSHRRDTLKFFDFFDSLVKTVPVLHSSNDTDTLEIVITIAKRMFITSPRLFMLAYYNALEETLMPAGYIARRGSIGTFCCPVQKFFLCYTIRVLKQRFPFTAIPVQEAALCQAEDALSSNSLEQYGDMNMRDFGRIPSKLLADMMSKRL